MNTALTLVVGLLAARVMGIVQAPPVAPKPVQQAQQQQPSQEDRMAKQAASAAKKLLPATPEVARVRAAMLEAGIDPTVATNERIAPFVDLERAACDDWRKGAETALLELVLKTMKDDPGSVLRARDISVITTRFEEGRSFELHALAAALRECSASEAQSHLATDVATANFPPPSPGGGLRSMGRISQALVDVLPAAIAADPSAADAFRGSLASYESERARLTADLFAAELQVIARNKSVALAAQEWARQQAADDNASAMTNSIEGIAMVAMLAPFAVHQPAAFEMQRRALAVVDGAMPPDAAWLVYTKVLASDPATVFAVKAISASDNAVAKLPADRSDALRAATRDLKIADHNLMRKSFASAVKECAEMARVLKPLATGTEVTTAMIGEINDLIKSSEYGPMARMEDAKRITEARREAAKALTEQVEAALAAAAAPAGPAAP